jgi:hypothetical protein
MSEQVRSTYRPPAAFLKFLIDSGLDRRRPVEELTDHAIYWLDLTPLRIMAGAFTPFVVPTALSGHERVEAQQIEAVADQFHAAHKGHEGYFAVIVFGGRMEPIPDSLKRKLRLQQIVPIDNQDINAIMALPDRHRRYVRLVHPLVSYLGYEALSPYVPMQPAYGETFFGRTEALKDALPSRRAACVTIVGCRRIGKTSLLREVRKRMADTFGDRLRAAEIYGSTFHDSLSVLKSIIEQLYVMQPDAHRLLNDPELDRRFPAAIHALTARTAKGEPPLELVVFIDELDELLDMDAARDYALMRRLRAAFNGREHCRVMFAGFRRVMEESTRGESELFNFTKTIALEGLSPGETTEMIRQPLTVLGIPVSDDLISMIHQETKGRPELIQIYCNAILRAAEETGRPPSEAHLSLIVASSDAFRSRIYATFLSNATELEQLLCFLLLLRWQSSGLRIEDFDFGLQEADTVLRSNNVNLDFTVVERLLYNLRLVSIVEQIQPTHRYRFAVPALANYLVSQDVRFLVKKLLRATAKGSKWAHAAPTQV